MKITANMVKQAIQESFSCPALINEEEYDDTYECLNCPYALQCNAKLLLEFMEASEMDISDLADMVHMITKTALEINRVFSQENVKDADG